MVHVSQSVSQGCSAQLTDLKYFPTLKAQLNNMSSLKPPQLLKLSGSAVQTERLDTWRPVAGLGFYFESACEYLYIVSQPASHSQALSVSLMASGNTALTPGSPALLV